MEATESSETPAPIYTMSHTEERKCNVQPRFTLRQDAGRTNNAVWKASFQMFLSRTTNQIWALIDSGWKSEQLFTLNTEKF